MAVKTLGVMLDCSRNGVMKPEQVKRFAKLISDMGYNMLQLYTEDTYEIDGEPFFGHMRGRYSQAELKDIDTYCSSIGIELIPCIQVLAHLNQLPQWKCYESLFDCNDILMVGDERVYTLIDKMFQTLEKCFTSRRVNIGMDEAHFIGRGRYLDKHGYRRSEEVFSEHLNRVKEIADKYGFTMMIWSDMYIRLNNNGLYEFLEGDIIVPQETIDSVPEGVELIYWDYYSRDPEHYENMLRAHEKFNNPIAFAGGMWTWMGYAPNMRMTWDGTEAAMRSVNKHSLDTVFFTVWGNLDKLCSYYTMLPMLFAATEMAKGNFDKKDIAEKFANRYGYTLDEFMNLELPNLTEDEEETHRHNPGTYLLFNDPFMGLLDFTVASGLAERYAKAADIVKKSINGREYDYLFDIESKLLDVLSKKADLGVRLRKAYQSGDRETLRVIVEQDCPIIRERMKKFFESFREMWLRENKAFGLEVHQQRAGGLLYRMEECEKRIKEYLSGEITKIEELEEQSLVKIAGSEGKSFTWFDWKTVSTPGVI